MLDHLFFVDKYRTKPVPWGPLGYVTYKRTYSRMINGRPEEWYQTVARCVNGILDMGGVFTQEEAETLYDYVFNLKMCFAGRQLWQLGTDNINKIGADSLQNCWQVTCNELDAFMFTFNQLMLGGGVGFNIQPEYVYELPPVKYSVPVHEVKSWDVNFIVPDNREGWVDLLRRVLNVFFHTGKTFTYSVGAVRQRDEKINTFGGKASGATILVDGIKQICGILSSRAGYKLRPIDCLDIMNIIGSIVVAGNVRRSAQLALGDINDTFFLRAKNWKTAYPPTWRSQSNNSCAVEDTSQIPEAFWDNYATNVSEPYGLINLPLCRSHGRLKDGENYRPDYNVTGTNPCGEITLEPYEACNLFEIFLPNIETKHQLQTAAMLGYKVCKTIAKYPFSDVRSEEVSQRNMRIGIGLGGIMQSNWRHNMSVLSDTYNMLEAIDIQSSRELGCNTSIKLTTIKPSGTISLLAGITPGMHAAFAEYYIRRIRMPAEHELVRICHDSGYHVEPVLKSDGSKDLTTAIVSFPVKTPPGSVLVSELTLEDQLKWQKKLQHHWADNSVSMTCYYQPNEIDAIKAYLKEYYRDTIKAVSFCLHSEHGFIQAPYEEITRQQYQELKNTVQPISATSVGADKHVDSTCDTGHCPAR